MLASGTEAASPGMWQLQSPKYFFGFTLTSPGTESTGRFCKAEVMAVTTFDKIW